MKQNIAKWATKPVRTLTLIAMATTLNTQCYGSAAQVEATITDPASGKPITVFVSYFCTGSPKKGLFSNKMTLFGETDTE